MHHIDQQVRTLCKPTWISEPTNRPRIYYGGTESRHPGCWPPSDETFRCRAVRSVSHSRDAGRKQVHEGETRTWTPAGRRTPPPHSDLGGRPAPAQEQDSPPAPKRAGTCAPGGFTTGLHTRPRQSVSRVATRQGRWQPETKRARPVRARPSTLLRTRRLTYTRPPVVGPVSTHRDGAGAEAGVGAATCVPSGRVTRRGSRGQGRGRREVRRRRMDERERVSVWRRGSVGLMRHRDDGDGPKVGAG